MTASVDRVITARPRDIGSFSVRRYLPHARRRLVGPFIFFDHMGPVDFEAGQGMDVRPHPHINLATVTYLFDGAILHADSLGYHQPIHPGDVNWMTAGRGIVHSERTAPEVRARGQRLDGIQSWVALPTVSEEVPPDFHHHPHATLPVIEQGGATMRLIAGEAFGARSPVAAYSPMVYLDAQAPAGARIPVPDAAELAFYVVDGAVTLAGERYGAGTMVVLDGSGDAALAADEAARVMLLGGAPLDGPRHIWWNFVSSNPDRIEQAKDDWREGRFPGIEGDDEFIPLPEA
jgi:redox-sensitive bicupin YhaK (pirin superfamily)